MVGEGLDGWMIGLLDGWRRAGWLDDWIDGRLERDRTVLVVKQT